jgi:hypothetical protein
MRNTAGRCSRRPSSSVNDAVVEMHVQRRQREVMVATKILHQAFRQVARRVIDGVADGTFIRSSRLRFA